ncbi:magnesium/cobalt transporter CorA [Phototrophicus methaneseepsis]|uniref:Magnesium transport protein CorA n=1 Tax=Phototrophicus methaneseepsis TaxID=2710758 RepID=A0A7S8E873_9CHLR|nr:magnesium/cobalt transporter CorA [Phototrophicus methaneseepsis]QPC82073.1 magnesium/cobalt transporter CorA [Phototrophicus methaneseepsis]
MGTQTLTYGSVTWIDIIHPTPADVENLQERFPYIHPLNLEDVRSPMERPKIDVDDNYLFVVMHFPLFDKRLSLSRPREVDLIIGRGYVVTVHDGVLKPLTTLYELCEDDELQRQRLLGRGANHAFYTIIDQLVDYVLPILRKVDGNIRDIEEDIFTRDTREVIREISLVRRDVIALRRIIRQQVPIVEQLEQVEHPIIHEDLEEYFGDIADHLYKARDIVDENYEIITSLADTVDTLASHRINEVMRILTVISVIMLPLTLISSIYGMNVPLPGQPEFRQDPNSFWLIAVFMVLISLVMLWYFRKRNWL